LAEELVMATRTDDTHPNAEAFPSGMSGPSLRALAHAGVRTMAQLAQRTEAEVAALHGMGPKGVRILRDGLAAQGRHFRRPTP
jgi:predicted flap endonuclease-1-like 5' DNA nuclease